MSCVSRCRQLADHPITRTSQVADVHESVSLNYGEFACGLSADTCSISFQT